MTHVPIVLLVAESSSTPYDPSRCERTAVDDVLPAVLDLDDSRYALERATRFTEVIRETTDDK
jgi:hypothetical protein